MIVVHRLEITDEQRSALSLRLHPNAAKRLATGREVKEYLAECWTDITKPVVKAESYRPFDDEQEMRFETPNPNFGTSIKPVLATQEENAIMASLLADMPIAVGPQVTLTDAPKELPPITAPVEAGEELYGLRQLIHHVNCAMFSIAHAVRMSKEFAHPDSASTITRLDDEIQGLRMNLAAEHDEQIPEREGAGWSDS